MPQRYVIEGVVYVFNQDKFKGLYDERANNIRGKKTAIKNGLAERCGVTVAAVEQWVKKNSSPDNIVIIDKMAAYLGVNKDILLRKENETYEEKGEKPMRVITDIERNTARTLFEEMCDLIADAEYADPAMEMITGNWLQNDEPRRFAMLRRVAKASFDLPAELTDQLAQMINEIFGPYIDDHDAYFRSDEYHQYLELNGMENNDDSKYMYSAIFISQLNHRLRSIFSDYLIKE